MRARAYLPGCLPLQSAPFAALSHRSLGLSFPLPSSRPQVADAQDHDAGALRTLQERQVLQGLLFLQRHPGAFILISTSLPLRSWSAAQRPFFPFYPYNNKSLAGLMRNLVHHSPHHSPRASSSSPSSSSSFISIIPRVLDDPFYLPLFPSPFPALLPPGPSP